MVNSLLLRFWFGFGFDIIYPRRFLITITNSNVPEAHLLPMSSKKTKSSETLSNGDRISGFPEPVIHHIMSFLPPEDVIRTGSLSKTWHSHWSTYPNLDFDQTAFKLVFPTLSVKEKLDLFLSSVNRSLQCLEQKSMNIHKLKFHAAVQDPYPFDLCVERALERNVQELDLDYSDKGNQYYKDEHNDKLRRYFYAMPRCLYSAKSVKCLKLMRFEVGIMDLLSGCPSIEELILEQCKVSEKALKLSSHKLVKFHVKLQVRAVFKSIELDACNLQSFQYDGYSITKNGTIMAPSLTQRNCTINLSTCTFLRNLSFTNAKVSDQWLEHHLSKLVYLEDLSLDSCRGLTRVGICHEKLKTLCLLSCVSMQEAKIDCPNLRRFAFKGGMPHIEFLNTSGSLVATLKVTTVGCFPSFRRLLGFFGHCKTLKIVCDSYKDLVFPEEVKENSIPPLLDLKHLKIKCSSSTVEYTQLLDSLFWLSPHLEMLLLTSQNRKRHLKLKFQYKKISEGKGEADLVGGCCRAYPKECWRHCLERVIIDNVDDFPRKSDAHKNLLNYFCESAKGLESIQDNSRSFKVVEGKYF